MNVTLDHFYLPIDPEINIRRKLIEYKSYIFCFLFFIFLKKDVLKRLNSKNTSSKEMKRKNRKKTD